MATLWLCLHKKKDTTAEEVVSSMVLSYGFWILFAH